MFPLDIKKHSADELAIEWDDGHTSVFSLSALRNACPCASCRALKEQSSTAKTELQLLRDDLKLVSAEIIGRYAVQFTWSDGHKEGIYSFNYLQTI
jgi:DUF971 family protein